jgi:hypothetical protein
VARLHQTFTRRELAEILRRQRDCLMTAESFRDSIANKPLPGKVDKGYEVSKT